MTQCSGWQSPGWSNPNLLVNWDFRNPVNQRGQTSYVGAGYGIDMWWLQYVSILQIKDGYVTYSGMWELRQHFECPLVPGIYTLSIKAANCNGKTVFRCVSGQNESIVEFIIPEIGAEWEFKKITFCAEKSISYISFYNVGQEDATMDIQAVKLEVGPISTLALDLMQPSDYTAELRKCQRYLQIYNVPLWFYAPQEWYAETIFDLQEEMRIIPSFSFEGNVEIMRDNGDLDILVSTVTQFSGNTTKPLLRLAIDNSKAVIGHSYLLRELKLIFSAEL